MSYFGLFLLRYISTEIFPEEQDINKYMALISWILHEIKTMP